MVAGSGPYVTRRPGAGRPHRDLREDAPGHRVPVDRAKYLWRRRDTRSDPFPVVRLALASRRGDYGPAAGPAAVVCRASAFSPTADSRAAGQGVVPRRRAAQTSVTRARSRPEQVDHPYLARYCRRRHAGRGQVLHGLRNRLRTGRRARRLVGQAVLLLGVDGHEQARVLEPKPAYGCGACDIGHTSVTGDTTDALVEFGSLLRARRWRRPRQ